MKILLFVLAAFLIFSAAILVALSIVAGSAVGIIVGLAVMVGVIATCYVLERDYQQAKRARRLSRVVWVGRNRKPWAQRACEQAGGTWDLGPHS